MDNGNKNSTLGASKLAKIVLNYVARVYADRTGFPAFQTIDYLNISEEKALRKLTQMLDTVKLSQNQLICSSIVSSNWPVTGSCQMWN